MKDLRQGSIRLLRFAGVDLFLHWSWFLVAALEITYRARAYSSLTWVVLEHFALFLLVMLHEFGHALACQQVGGTVNQIVLSPLGGVTYVNPPPRAGATLWCIAAGPMVNIAVLPVLWLFARLSRSLDLVAMSPDAHSLLQAVWLINLSLLIFNLLPIYPLDGGQILRSLLWFAIGRAQSLMVVTVLGFVCVAGFIMLAFWRNSIWLGIFALFLLANCIKELKRAEVLSRLPKLPGHGGFVCPSCQAVPPVGELWMCAQCRKPFDTFETQAVCPHCATEFPVTACLDCGERHAMSEWAVPVAALLTP
jgi:Zn-dependent protease